MILPLKMDFQQHVGALAARRVKGTCRRSLVAKNGSFSPDQTLLTINVMIISVDDEYKARRCDIQKGCM